MASELDDQLPPPVARFILAAVAMHALIQLGAESPETIAKVAYANADAMIAAAKQTPAP